MDEFNKLLEAFNDFNLREAAFEVDEEGAEEYFDFIDDDEEGNELEVVDVEAETEEDTEDKDYINDIAIQCKTCHGIIAKKEEEIDVGEDGKPLAEITEEDTVNAEEECPLCGGLNGFCVLGKIVPYVDVDVEVKDEEEGEEKVDELLDVTVDAHEFGGTGNDVDVLSPGKSMPAMKEGKECKEEDTDELQEAVNKFAGLKEGDGEAKVEVDDAKVELDAGEGSANVKMDGTEVDIDTKSDNDELGLGPIEDDTAEVIEDEDEFDSFDDIDIDEVDEESVEEAYKKAKPYCEKFRVKDVYHNNGKIVVEGIAKLRNGDRARTRFSLTPRSLRGEKATFITEGLGLRDRCFGTLSNKKIVVESFKSSKKNSKKGR